VSERAAFRPVPHLTAVCRLGAGTSGTGVGANFDLERTARDSRPFHAKWDPIRANLQRVFESHVALANAAAEARDWTRAERHCWDAQRLKIWDVGTLTMLSRIFEVRRDPAHAKRLAAAAERAKWLNSPPLSHTMLMNLHARLKRGNAYAQVGENELAEKEFMGALALHEGDQTACNGMANLRIAQGRLADAEEFLRQGTLWGDRIYPTLLLKRGSLLEQLQRRDDARRIYQHLVNLVPRYAPARGRLQALDAIAAAAA
jgi:tetratricopeptide (TPR) repeat protein